MSSIYHKQGKLLKKDSQFYTIILMMYSLIFILSLTQNKIIISSVFAILIIIVFIQIRHIQNRRHNNKQYEEINYQLNELIKDVKELKIKIYLKWDKNDRK